MIITFAHIKGGVGKSTVAVNLAVALAQSGARVGLLDTDSQCTLAHWAARRERIDRQPRLECLVVQGQLKDTLKALNKRNDYVFVDTAGFKNMSLGPALVNSHMAICPFAPKPFDLEVAPDLMAHESLQASLQFNPKLKLRAMLNACPTTANDSRANEAAEYLKGLGIEVLNSRLMRRDAYADATQTGLGVTEYGDKRAIEEIMTLMNEVISHGK